MIHLVWLHAMLHRGSFHLRLSVLGLIGRLHVLLLHPIEIVGRLLEISIALASSNKVRLNLSATPFWEGEYGAEVSIIIPSSAASFLSLSLTSSFPLSKHSHFRTLPHGV